MNDEATGKGQNQWLICIHCNQPQKPDELIPMGNFAHCQNCGSVDFVNFPAALEERIRREEREEWAEICERKIDYWDKAVSEEQRDHASTKQQLAAARAEVKELKKQLVSCGYMFDFINTECNLENGADSLGDDRIGRTCRKATKQISELLEESK